MQSVLRWLKSSLIFSSLDVRSAWVFKIFEASPIVTTLKPQVSYAVIQVNLDDWQLFFGEKLQNFELALYLIVIEAFKFLDRLFLPYFITITFPNLRLTSVKQIEYLSLVLGPFPNLFDGYLKFIDFYTIYHFPGDFLGIRSGPRLSKKGFRTIRPWTFGLQNAVPACKS